MFFCLFLVFIYIFCLFSYVCFLLHLHCCCSSSPLLIVITLLFVLTLLHVICFVAHHCTIARWGTIIDFAYHCCFSFSPCYSSCFLFLWWYHPPPSPPPSSLAFNVQVVCKQGTLWRLQQPLHFKKLRFFSFWFVCWVLIFLLMYDSFVIYKGFFIHFV